MNTDWREFRLVKGKRVQVWKIRQLGDAYETTHGILDGQFQVFSDKPGDKGKFGTKAYIDAIKNCDFNISREIRKKEEHGYIEFVNGDFVKTSITEIDFTKCLPKNFAALKPQTDIKSEALVKIHNHGNARYTRKFDGQMHLAVKHPWGWEIYTRRIDLATDRFPNHVAFLETTDFEPGTVLVGEILCSRENGTDDFKAVSRICRSLPEEARKLVETGEIPEPYYQVFDILFYNGESLENTSYDDRRKFYNDLDPTGLVRPVELHKVTPDNWEKTAKDNGWEGFVVVDGSSKPGDKFFSFDGRPKRPKGHHKLKPCYTEDVVVYAGVVGSGKRADGIGAVFVKQKHPDTNEWGSYGKVGSGFTDSDLEDIEKLFAKLNLPIVEKDKDAESIDIKNNSGIVIEIEYGERITKTNKFRFPVFIRMHNDKLPEECFIQRFAPEDDEE